MDPSDATLSCRRGFNAKVGGGSELLELPRLSWLPRLSMFQLNSLVTKYHTQLEMYQAIQWEQGLTSASFPIVITKLHVLYILSKDIYRCNVFSIYIALVLLKGFCLDQSFHT